MTYTDLNPSATTKQGAPPIWACEMCREPVDTGHGWIGVNKADIRLLRQGHTDFLLWHCYHGSGKCDPVERSLSDEWFFVSINAVATWFDLHYTVGYLSEQWWFERSNWFDFIHAADTGDDE